ncbi:MAG: RNA polymerase sigma factor [Acidimicrobiales bacterium]
MDDLIARFRAGDPEAVRAVHRRHGGAVRTVARAMVGDPDLVADVVQQTFIKAWRAAATFDEHRELAPWLYSIARRTAIDVLRRERRPTMGGHAPEIDVAVTPMSFERTWTVYEVRRAIDDLPADEREVVRLSHLAGLTHTEIAHHLGIPLGTVKSRSGRAHRRLAAALGHLRADTRGGNREAASSVEGGED